MNHDEHARGSGRRRAAGKLWRRAPLLLAAALSCCACGGELDREAALAPLATELEPTSSAPGGASGTLALDASYTGTEAGPLVAWLSPLVTSSGAACPRTCGFAAASCEGECLPAWVATDVAARWPGVSSLQLDAVPPGRYWLFAYIPSGAADDGVPRAGDPVSRDAPLLVEVAAGGQERASLTLDAQFAPAVAAAHRATCPSGLAGELLGNDDDDASSATTPAARRARDGACNQRR